MVWRVFCALALAGALLVAPFLTMAVPASAQELAAPTAADFGALPILYQPSLSPDGKKIAARGLINGKQYLLVYNLADTSGKRMRTFAMLEKYQLKWVRWAGNDRVLISLSRKTVLFEQEMQMTRIAMIDLNTGKIALVGPREQGVDGDDLVHVDKSGQFVLLSTQASIFEYPAVYRTDLNTGKSSLIVPAQDGVWEWFADQRGVVRVGRGIDGAKTWLLYRSSEAAKFERVQRHNANKDDEKNNIQQFEPVAGSDQGYAIAEGKTGRLALYRFDFKADALGEIVYENPIVDVDDYLVGRDGDLLGISYIDDRAEIAWFDPELKRQQQGIDKALPGAINRIASVSEDKNVMLVWSGSATDPGSYLVYDKPNKHMFAIAEPYAAVSGKRLAAMESVRYKARDGLEIRAYLTLPPGKEKAKGLPLVVMPHGGPFARDEWGYDSDVQYLASKGYAVLQPNYRGSTGFGRAFVEKGTGQFGRGMQDDVDDGVKWLADRGTVDPKRVCIMGSSYGGYAAMLAAVRNPEIYRCAISFAGLSDVASQLRYSRKSFSASRYFADWRERVMGEKDFALETISPLKQAAKMTVPILIAHGTEDDTVPIYQSRRMHEALLKLKRPHEYVEYPGEGHGFADEKNSIDFLTRVGAFLDKHNPATP